MATAVLTNILEDKKRSLVVLLFINLIVYGQTFFFKFTQYDDDFLITKNMELLKYISNIGALFKQPYLDFYYRPIVMLSFMLDTQIGAGLPVIYHITNVVIHIAATSFLYLIILKFLRSKEIAFFTSALFAVLPLLTQAVAWIPGRNDSLLGLFLLASLYMLLLFLEKKEPKFFIAHCILFFLGLLTKEIAFLFPVPLLLYIVLKSNKEQRKKRLTPLLIGWGIALALAWYMRSQALATSTVQGSAISLTAFFANLRAIPEIFGKLFFPVNLSAYAVYSVLSTALGIVVLFALFLLFLQKKQTIDTRIILFGAVWFIALLLPSLAVDIEHADKRFQYLESRAYIPVVGILLILAELTKAWIGAFSKKEFTGAIALLCMFAVITLAHSRNFKNAETTWTHITTATPTSPEAFFILGTIYEDSTNLQQAALHYERAVKLDSMNISYHNNLGSAYAKMGNLQQASREFFKSIALDSLNPYPYHNLGSICYLTRRFPQAEYYWQKAVQLDPDVTDPYMKLIRLYIMERRQQEALYYAQLLKQRGTDIVAQVLQSFQKMAADSIASRK